MKPRPYACFHYDAYWHGKNYSDTERTALSRLLELRPGLVDQGKLTALSDKELGRIEVLLCGWGATPLSAELLQRMPALSAVFYAAGDAKGLIAEGVCYDRGVRIVSANVELARSVAEHTLGLIIVSLKNVWGQAALVKKSRTFHREPGPGFYAGVVGLVGYGTVARALRKFLLPFGVRVIVYDPYLSDEEAKVEGVELYPLLELCAEAHVVSVHAPLSYETSGMMGGTHVKAMRTNATLINTARGGILNEIEVMSALGVRSDLWAILDVLEEEPPVADHPVFDLPNVILTPHVAGCLGLELARLGRFITAEVGRWRNGEKLVGEVVATKVAV